MQEHDRLRVDDLRADVGQCFVEWQFDDFGVLAFVGESCLGAVVGAGLVGAGVEVQFFGHGAGAHVGVEDVLQAAYFDAGLLRCLAAGAVLWTVFVEQTGGHFEQHPVDVAVDVGRVAELAHQHDRARVDVVEQHGRTITAVVGFAVLGGPAAVAVPVLETGAAQHVPVV